MVAGDYFDCGSAGSSALEFVCVEGDAGDAVGEDNRGNGVQVNRVDFVDDIGVAVDCVRVDEDWSGDGDAGRCCGDACELGHGIAGENDCLLSEIGVMGEIG